ncbi:hypothetical protein ACFU6K_36605, partial [Kitasatospora sp. NPDC057512]
MADDGFSISDIYALGNQWIELGTTVYAARYGTSMAMDKFQWTGDGMVAAHEAWNLVGNSVLDPAVTTCWKIGDAINDYGRALEKIMAAEQKAANAAGLASIIATILGFVLPFGLGFLAKLIAPLLEGLITLITNILRTIGESLQTILNIGAFIGGAVAGGLLQLGTDLLAQLIADKIYDVPFEIDWAAEGMSMGFGAAFGGLAGLAGLRGPKEVGIGGGPKGVGGKGVTPPKVDPPGVKPPATEHLPLPGRGSVPLPEGPGHIGGVTPGGIGKVPPPELFPGGGKPLGAEPGSVPPGRSPVAPGGVEPPKTGIPHEAPGTTPPGPPRTTTPGRGPEPVTREPGQLNPSGTHQPTPGGQVKPGTGVHEPGAGGIGNVAPPKSTGGQIGGPETHGPLNGKDGSLPDLTSRSVNETGGNGGSRGNVVGNGNGAGNGARPGPTEQNPGHTQSETPLDNQTYKASFDRQPGGTRTGGDLGANGRPSSVSARVEGDNPVVTTDRNSLSAKAPGNHDGLPGGNNNRPEGVKQPLKEGAEAPTNTQRTATGGGTTPRDTPLEPMRDNGKPGGSSGSVPKGNERTNQSTGGQKPLPRELEPQAPENSNRQSSTASSAKEPEGSTNGAKQTTSESTAPGKGNRPTSEQTRQNGQQEGTTGKSEGAAPKKPSTRPFGAKKMMTFSELNAEGSGPRSNTAEAGMRPGGSNVETISGVKQSEHGAGGSTKGGSSTEKPSVDRGAGYRLDGKKPGSESQVTQEPTKGGSSTEKPSVDRGAGYRLDGKKPGSESQVTQEPTKGGSSTEKPSVDRGTGYRLDGKKPGSEPQVTQEPTKGGA